MKLYIAHGTYVGTQAEAKAITKDFELVEVPVDKAGLIDYLNGLCAAIVDDTPAVVIENTPPTTIIELPREPIDLDSAFEAAPLSMQLRLAVVAIDAASANLFEQARAAKEPYHPPVNHDDPVPGEQVLTASQPCTLGPPADASDLL